MHLTAVSAHAVLDTICPTLSISSPNYLGNNVEQIITYVVRSTSPSFQPFVHILDTVQLKPSDPTAWFGPKTSTGALLHKFHTDPEFQFISKERLCFGIWMRKRQPKV